MKAAKSSTGDISAKEVFKAAKDAKLPKDIRATLKSLANTAQANLAALDKFTGKDLAAAMQKNADGTVDWKDGNATAQAFKEAQDLSKAIADALGQIKDGNAQATLEEMMLQCDRRVAEIDTLVLQMTEIIDKGGKHAQADAAALTKGGTISSFKSENALEKFGRNEMFNALKSDLQPLTNRIEQYANDGVKDIKKADVDACTRELNAIRAKFSAAAASGTLTVGTKTVFVDRSLLGEASKLLDDVGKKINSLHHEVLHRAMVRLVENEIPFINEELFSPKFADQISTLLTHNPTEIRPDELADYVKMLNTFRSAARKYVESPTNGNAAKLKAAANAIAMAPTDGVQRCLTTSAISDFRAPAEAPEDFKQAFRTFQHNVVKSSGLSEETPISKLINSYDNISIAANRLIALGKEMNAEPDGKYFISGAVLDVFKGETSLSPLVESRVHGYSDSDINHRQGVKEVGPIRNLENE